MTHPFRQTGSTGRITLEYWEGVPHDSVNSVGENGSFPDRPDGRTAIESFSVRSGWTDAHSVRMRGYLQPPSTGSYTFTTNGQIDLYVGENALESSSRRVLSSADDCSDAIFLTGGEEYYVEAVCIAGGDGGGMDVGWQLPDGTRVEVIDGTYLSPYRGGRDIPDAHRLFSSLSRKHPRLLATAYDFAVLRDEIRAGGQMAEQYEAIRQQGLDLLDQPMPEYTYTDPYVANFEGRGNQLIQMMETIGFIYNIESADGDRDLGQRCIDRAWEELEAASHFEHWDTEHFASTSRMAHAYGMGYDWFYNAFTVEQRAVVRKAIVELGIVKYAEELNRGPFGWHQWTVMKGNWNCTNNGDTGIAILAVAGEEDYLAEDVFHKLLVNTKNFSMMTYYPDGGTRESPSYWQYKEQYFLPFFPALETALGTDFGMGSTAGFAQTGLYPIHSMGPSGMFFDYSDGGPNWSATPGLLYLARTFDMPLYAWMHRHRFGDATSVRSILWNDDRGSQEDLLGIPLDRYFGDAEVAYMRGAWEDPNSSWVGFAATDNWDFIHGQLDQGTFVFDALGQRWATDFGADNYGLPGYWDKDTGGIRWKAYRIRAEGHNTLVVNPGSTHEDQQPMAKGKMVDFSSAGSDPFAIADLTDAYKQNGALRVRRGVKLVGRKTLLVCDELTLENPSEVWWFMHTQAEIAVAADGCSATLSQEGKQVEVTLLDAPDGAKLIAMDAERLPSSPGPTPGELGAEEYRKLAVKMEGVTDMRLAVALVPEGGQGVEKTVASLTSWNN